MLLPAPFANTIVPAGDLAFVDRCIGVEAAEMAAAQAPDNLHVVIVDGLGRRCLLPASAQRGRAVVVETVYESHGTSFVFTATDHPAPMRMCWRHCGIACGVGR